MQELLSEDHLKSLLSEEWLVQIDGQKSVPYLLKFHHSTMDLSCIILATDTKSVWAEVLDGKQFARRWRSCNPNSPAPYPDQADEDSWRETTLELLSNAHTLGGISELAFEVVESNFSDFAFELQSSHFKWRWESNFAGYRSSAEILSKQLILPLISVAHISLSSPDAVSSMTDADVEKNVDKVGRTARRAPDTHVKNALTKPRTATMLRRITAMFNHVPNLPPIFSTAEKPDLQPQVVEQQQQLPKPRSAFDENRPKASVQNRPPASDWEAPAPVLPAPSPPNRSEFKGKKPERIVPDESETEDEDGGIDNDPPPPPKKLASAEGTEKQDDAVMGSPSPAPSSSTSKAKAKAKSRVGASRSSSPQHSDPDPPHPKPPSSSSSAAKKPRLADPSSDDDSDAAPKPTQTTAARRGARQPVKRGGKRF